MASSGLVLCIVVAANNKVIGYSIQVVGEIIIGQITPRRAGNSRDDKWYII